MTLAFDEHIDPTLRKAWQDMQSIGKELMSDEHFSHIFKKIESEHLIAGVDGDFVNMQCSSWLDLSQEAERAHYDKPEWVTDFSLIKSIERDDIVAL